VQKVLDPTGSGSTTLVNRIPFSFFRDKAYLEYSHCNFMDDYGFYFLGLAEKASSATVRIPLMRIVRYGNHFLVYF
jgi:hypothetical protein